MPTSDLRPVARFLLLPVLFLLAGSVFGQEQPQLKESKVRVGLRAGLNMSKVVGNQVVEKGDFRPGGHGGIFLKARISDISIQPEILISSKGNSYSGQLFKDTVQISSRLLYLDIPFFVNFTPDDDFSFLLGPQISLLMKGITPTLPNPAVQREAWGYSFLCFGITAGVGYQLSNNFNLGIRGAYDLTPSFHINGEDPSFKNINLQLTLGILFDPKPATEDKDRSSYKSVY